MQGVISCAIKYLMLRTSLIVSKNSRDFLHFFVVNIHPNPPNKNNPHHIHPSWPQWNNQIELGYNCSLLPMWYSTIVLDNPKMTLPLSFMQYLTRPKKCTSPHIFECLVQNWANTKKLPFTTIRKCLWMRPPPLSHNTNQQDNAPPKPSQMHQTNNCQHQFPPNSTSDTLSESCTSPWAWATLPWSPCTKVVHMYTEYLKDCVNFTKNLHINSFAQRRIEHRNKNVFWCNRAPDFSHTGILISYIRSHKCQTTADCRNVDRGFVAF
jgi:hypothetical protein